MCDICYMEILYVALGAKSLSLVNYHVKLGCKIKGPRTAACRKARVVFTVASFLERGKWREGQG